MPDAADNARKQREQAFHDTRYGADGVRRSVAKYYAIDRGHDRFRELIDSLTAPGIRVLDYGCGTGTSALRVGRRGADVTGVDLSPVAIAQAKGRAERSGVACEFRVMDAEDLDLPDVSFDVVYGVGILHHLDTDRALAEVARVLRPGGTAVFFEPLGHNPAINAYRRLTPGLRSPDEHPLRTGEIDRAANHFSAVEWESFNLLALAGTPLRGRRRAERLVALLHRFDRLLFAHSAIARRWAWVAVLTLRR